MGNCGEIKASEGQLKVSGDFQNGSLPFLFSYTTAESYNGLPHIETGYRTMHASIRVLLLARY